MSKESDHRLEGLAEEESAALQGIRFWRSQHRKKMVDAMERLIEQAVRIATSQYTRSSQRAGWTRIAGQLIWYKDHILRSMTWEALEQDTSKMVRDIALEELKQRRQSLGDRWTPTIVKKKKDEEPEESDDPFKESASG